MTHHTDDQLLPFERDQLADLRGYVTTRGEEPARRRGRLALAAAAAAAAVAGSLTLLGGGSPAYALETGDDGTVTVRILDRSDAAGLQEALAERGVTADVDYSGDSAVSILEGPDGLPELVPTDDTPPPVDVEPLLPPDPDVPTVVTVASGDHPCPHTQGGAVSPIRIARDGDEYVVTLDGPAVAPDADLDLAIFIGGHTEGVAGVYTDGPQHCGGSTIFPLVQQ